MYLIRASYISVMQEMLNYLLRSLIKENVCHYLPDDMGGGGIMKEVTNSDIVGKEV